MFWTYDIKGVMGSTVLLAKRIGKDVDPPTGSVRERVKYYL